MAGHWRRQATPIVARVIEQTEGQPLTEVRKALREAYPFGPRTGWPYKVWCSEVRYQLNLPRILERPKERDLEGQLTLFD